MNAVATLERPEAADLLQLLLAACGARHPENWGRAARSPLCWQELEVYALAPHGTYRYHVHENRFALVDPQDLRALAGPAGNDAASLKLVYVADLDHLRDHPEEHGVYAGAHAGCIADEVARRCACSGRGSSVVRAFDRTRLRQALGLQPTQRIVLVQRLGGSARRASTRQEHGGAIP